MTNQSTNQPLLEIDSLNVHFSTTHGSLHAVRNVSLSVSRGQCLAIVGESGSGKSVSMMAVMGLLPWTAKVQANRLRFDGVDLLDVKARRNIVGKRLSMIFQEPMSSLNPSMTVEKQIGEALSTHLGLSRSAQRTRILELLTEVGIPDPERRLSAYPHQLSGGMCQRVMIAMAISCKPELLIADEPTTALDVTIQAQILELLARLQKSYGMALVLITHDIGVVAQAAENVVVQYAGQVVEQRPTKELLRNPHHPYSSALLAALPERAIKGQELPTIAGMVPRLDDLPTGCTFAARYQFATELCRTQNPSWQHQALCFHPLGVKNAA